MEHPLQVAPRRHHRCTSRVVEGQPWPQGEELLRHHRLDRSGQRPSRVRTAAGRRGAQLRAGSTRRRTVRADLAELLRRRRAADRRRPARGGGQAPRAGAADGPGERRGPVRPGSFAEYGGFAFAAQEARRAREDLHANTPADGLITGIGRVNGDAGARGPGPRARSSPTTTRCSPAPRASATTPRRTGCFELVERLRLPVVLFAEGGGGRPGDTDMPVVAGLDTRAFEHFAGCRAWCRRSASPPAAASPATPRCSGAATSSSPPPTATSAWAARR